MAPTGSATYTIILARVLPVLERGNQRRTVCPKNSIFLWQGFFFRPKLAVAYSQGLQTKLPNKSITDRVLWQIPVGIFYANDWRRSSMKAID